MNYTQTLEYIEEAGRYGIVPGLAGMRRLLSALGRPQDVISFIQIAGTNGKGSVQAFLASILKCAGIRAGSFTSPAVLERRESISVGGRPLSENAFAEVFTRVREAADEIEAAGHPHPTAFEMETAAAFCAFAEAGCELAILEAGMGGREDATNVAERTILSVITSISMDHMAFLGNSLEEIAAQKAGIIKKGAAVAACGGETSVSAVLAAEAAAQGCPYVEMSPARLSEIDLGWKDGPRTAFSYEAANGRRFETLEIAMAGAVQPENAALALEAALLLAERGLPVTETHIRLGLLSACWPCRLSVLSGKPLFLADGAHNRDGARRLAESVKAYFPGRRLIFIMGVFSDKDYEGMLEETAGLSEHFITVKPPGERGLAALSLAEAARRVNGQVTAADSVEEAVEMALLLSDEDTVTIAFGSLSYLGALHRIMEQKAGLRLRI